MTTIPSNELLNLTPHNIVVYPEDEQSKLIMYERSGVIGRLNTAEQVYEGRLGDGCLVYSTQQFTGVFPERVPETIDKCARRGVIVSMPMAQWMVANVDRLDESWRNVEIYSSDTGTKGAVRDEHGKLIGTRRLVCYRS